jgi:hypothetical protein
MKSGLITKNEAAPDSAKHFMEAHSAEWRTESALSRLSKPRPLCRWGIHEVIAMRSASCRFPGSHAQPQLVRGLPHVRIDDLKHVFERHLRGVRQL